MIWKRSYPNKGICKVTGYFAHETLINDDDRRAEFFSIYEKLIKRLKKMGRIEAATEHAKIRNGLKEDLCLLD